MIGKIERDKVQEMGKGMSEEYVLAILETFDERLLWMELMRRSAEKDSIVKDIRKAVEQERGIDGLLINE